jgi:hypothetical protein
MGMRGELGIFSAAEILQLIGSQEKSGVLEVRSKGRTAVLFFDAGKIISARDRRQSASDPFLSYLLENGEITIQDVHKVAEAKKDEGGDVVEIMLKQAILNEGKLGDLLSQYALQIVTNIVKWETGTYEFSASADGMPDKALGKPVRLEPILMEALRRKDEVEEIRRFLPGLDTKLDLAEPNYESLPLEDDDLAILRLVNGIRTIDQVIEESTVDEVETLDILEKLFALGIISIAADAPDSAPPRRIPARTSMLLALAALVVAGAIRIGVLGPGLLMTPQAANLRSDITSFIEARELANLRYAIDAYRAIQGAYPDDLKQLATAGLVTPEATENAEGIPYTYIRSSEGDYYKLSP